MKQFIKHISYIFIILSCSMVNHLFAQKKDEVVNEKIQMQHKIKFYASADKVKGTTDETFTFNITLESPKEINLDIPEVGNKILGLRIIDFGQDDVKEIDQNLIKKKWYKVKADISGSYLFPGVELKYKLNGKEFSLKTADIFIEIDAPQSTSNNSEEAKDIRDIDSIIEADKSYIWIWSAFAGFILIMIPIGIYFYKKRKKENIIPPRPPYELAIDDLENLKAENLLENGEIKKFSFRLSHILRNYFEKMFDFPATDRTYEELKKQINVVEGPNEDLKNDFLYIVNKTDQAKFADLLYSKDEGAELIVKCSDFIDKTKPVNNSLEEDSVI